MPESGEDAERHLIERLRAVGLDVSPPGNVVAGKRIITASGTWIEWKKAMAAMYLQQVKAWEELIARFQEDGLKPHELEALAPELVREAKEDRARIQRELDTTVAPKR